MRRCRRLIGIVVAVAVATPGLLEARVVAAAPVINHPGPVPTTPAGGYPIVLDTPKYTTFNNECQAGCLVPRQVFATNQAGKFIVSGGNFFSTELQNGTVLNQKYLIAWNIDTKQAACTNITLDGEVTAIAPGPTAGTVFVGGRFDNVNGPDGVTQRRSKVVKLRLPDCSVDTSFVTTGINAKIGEMVVVGNRLFVGGDFTTIGGRAIATLAELDATTGAVNPAFSFSYANPLNARVRGLGVSPDGTRLILAGRFGTVTGSGRSIPQPTAVFNISNPAAPKLTGHSSSGYASINNLQDASVSRDGTLIALAFGAAAPAAFAYLTPTTEAAVTYRWQHSMVDSSFGIAVSNNAVYVGGHFCKPAGGPGPTELMAPNGLATCTGSTVAGGVWRTKLAALSLIDGTPLTWNPGQESFTGARALTVVPRGLLIGYDGVRTANKRVGATAFFDFGPRA